MNSYIYTDSGVAEHRAVYEFHHGPLPKGWDVHHVDEDKANNDISNLIALPHEMHMTVHRAQWSGRAHYTKQELLLLCSEWVEIDLTITRAQTRKTALILVKTVNLTFLRAI